MFFMSVSETHQEGVSPETGETLLKTSKKSAELRGKRVQVKSGSSGASKKAQQTFLEEQQEAVALPKNHPHVFRSLREVFQTKIDQQRSVGEKRKLAESYKKIEAYLLGNIDSLIQQAAESESGGITASKSLTGLPYTLRCLHDKETGETSFHISFGTFARGGEATIKDISIIGKRGLERRAQRSLRRETDEGRKKGAEEIAVSEAKNKETMALVRFLIEKGVPGIAGQVSVRYKGKRGEKEPSLSELYPRDLFQFVSALDPEDPSEKFDLRMHIAAELIKTVVLMHKNGVIHLDLKLENVFLTDKGMPRLGDFGMAVRTDMKIPPRGSVGWIAPEMYEAQEAGESVEARPAHDLWSLGVVLFTLVFRTNPFVDLQESIIQEKDPGERRKRIQEFRQAVQEQIDFLTTPNEYIDPSLGRIIGGLLALDPKKRMTDALLAKEFRIPWQD